MNRMYALSLSILLLTGSPDETTAALADRAQFPVSQHGFLYYLSLTDVPAAQRDDLEMVTRLIVPSLCRKPNLPPQLPVRVGDLMRIDTSALGWETAWPAGLIRHYPYRKDLSHAYPPSPPLVSSALWFVAQVTDPVEVPDLQYQLLYGTQSTPKTLAQYHAFWTVQQQRQDFLGFVEGKSGVALALARLIENRDTGNRTAAWSTLDSRVIARDSDPLENLIPGALKFDAGEHITGLPKRMSGRSGTLQTYFLADSKGNRQEKAPADIVVDHQQLRGPEIKNFVSCLGCHTQGLISPTLDSYTAYLRSGATITAKDKHTQEAIEAYLESDFAREIKRGQEDYAAAVDMCCGVKPEVVHAAFVKFVKHYDADVTLEQAALELGCKPDDLSLALGYASSVKAVLSARLAQLAHGVSMPRARFEEEQFYARKYLEAFQGK